MARYGSTFVIIIILLGHLFCSDFSIFTILIIDETGLRMCLVQLLVIRVNVRGRLGVPHDGHHGVALSLLMKRLFLFRIDLWLKGAVFQFSPLLCLLVVPELHVFLFCEFVQFFVNV